MYFENKDFDLFLQLFVFVKVTQLEELLAVRHSVFVVGGPGTGKSQVSHHSFGRYLFLFSK